MPYGGGEMPYGQPSPRKRATGGYTSATGNPVASARAAAGDKSVIANRAQAASYAQQAQNRGGSEMAGYLKPYATSGSGTMPSASPPGTPSAPSGRGGIFNITGPSDFIDGGGLGASGPEFKGGMISGAMNLLGVTPYAARSAGGRAEDGDAVPIVAAGGEYVIPPEDVAHIGNGSLDDGHKILDAFVKKMRKKTIRTLQSLPGPKKD
jgi:hypothetical protein